MKPKKQKRIRAERHYLYLLEKQCLCFCIPVADVPALIEQLEKDFVDAPTPFMQDSMRYALKRAGITAGRKHK